MSGNFRKAVKIIEDQLVEYTGEPYRLGHTPYPYKYTYAMICGTNQTYTVGFTKDPVKLQEKFNLWRDSGDTSKLPKKFRDVLLKPTAEARLFITLDDNKVAYKRVHRHLEEELTQFA